MTPDGKHVAFIGGGQMAEALLNGLLESGTTAGAALAVTDASAARRQHLEQRFGIRVGADNREAAAWADVIVLAVKPQVLPVVLAEIAPFALDRLVVSIAAGVPIPELAGRLPQGTRLARVMPNMPALIREGMSALTFGPGITTEDEALVTSMFTSVGKVAVIEERLMDAATGLCGSGPAYVFLAIEALADGGVKMGLARSVAEVLAAQTVFGAARTVLETGEHPAWLKDRVASPAGTTIAALHCLEQGAFRATLMAAVKASTQRAEEMGRACFS